MGGSGGKAEYKYRNKNHQDRIHLRSYQRKEVVFQDLLRALWTSINADHERAGLPALTGVADIDFAAYDTTYADFRLCVYSFLSLATVGTGEQLLSCAKSDVEGLRKACRQEKARERKLAEKGIDNDLLLSGPASQSHRLQVTCFADR